MLYLVEISTIFLLCLSAPGIDCLKCIIGSRESGFNDGTVCIGGEGCIVASFFYRPDPDSKVKSIVDIKRCFQGKCSEFLTSHKRQKVFLKQWLKEEVSGLDQHLKVLAGNHRCCTRDLCNTGRAKLPDQVEEQVYEEDPFAERAGSGASLIVSPIVSLLTSVLIC